MLCEPAEGGGVRSMLLAGVLLLGATGSATLASAVPAPSTPNIGPAHHTCAVRPHATRRTPPCLLELAVRAARGLGDPRPTRRSWTLTTAGRSGYADPNAASDFRHQPLLGMRLDGDFVQQYALGPVRSREVRLLVDPATRRIVSWQFVGASYEGRLPPLGSLGDGSHRF
jgi:hypothetical protein